MASGLGIGLSADLGRSSASLHCYGMGSRIGYGCTREELAGFGSGGRMCRCEQRKVTRGMFVCDGTDTWQTARDTPDMILARIHHVGWIRLGRYSCVAVCRGMKGKCNPNAGLWRTGWRGVVGCVV